MIGTYLTGHLERDHSGTDDDKRGLSDCATPNGLYEFAATCQLLPGLLSSTGRLVIWYTGDGSIPAFTNSPR